MRDARPDLLTQLVHVLDRPDVGSSGLGTGSQFKCLWRCPACSHEWVATVAARCGGTGCPECAKAVRARSRAAAREGEALVDLHPTIAAEWVTNLDRPDMAPDELRPSSKQRCVWLCPACSKRYEATVANRVRGRGCRWCAYTDRGRRRREVPPGSPSAADMAPELLDEHVRNITTGSSLRELRPGSLDRCLWRCSGCGHEWEATVVNRVTKGSGCPLCAHIASASRRRTAAPGQSLADRHPDIAAEFSGLVAHPDLLANSIRPGSPALAWWRCSKGHAWATTIVSRTTSGTGCARCQALGQSRFELEVAELLEESLGTSVLVDHPLQTDERTWRMDLYLPDLDTYVDLDPVRWHQDAARDQRKVTALANHLATANKGTYVRVRQTGTPPICPAVNVQVVEIVERSLDPALWTHLLLNSPGALPDHAAGRILTDAQIAAALSRAARRWQATLRGRPKRSAMDARPELSNEWRRNLSRPGISLEWLAPSSKDQAEWQCGTCAHVWSSSVASRAQVGTSCPVCARAASARRMRARSIPAPEDSLASQYPSVAASFRCCLRDPHRTPEDLASHSNLVCEWSCPSCEVPFTASVAARVRRPDSGCRSCGNAKRGITRSRALKGDSLAAHHPRVASELIQIHARPGWDGDDVQPGSNLTGDWMCASCQHEWSAKISSRAVTGSGCPACGRERTAAARRRPRRGESLKDLHPAVAATFVSNVSRPYTRPDGMKPGSHDRCEWRCRHCGHSYVRVARDAVRPESRCPRCKTRAT
ncbi:zinc-ribbon domain-containing protein [Janibacter melonis]|nr:zinc-ribbon domain-containing protein [Janibacter melonis]